MVIENLEVSPVIENAGAENVSEQNPISEPTDIQPAEGGAQAQPASEDVIDWTKDKRFGKMWSKDGKPDPNLLFKSFKSMEDMYLPLSTQMKKLSGLAREKFGLESLDKLEDFAKSYDELKTNSEDWKTKSSFLDYYLGHPTLGAKAASMLQELENLDLQDKYPNMTKEQIEKSQELDERIKAIEAREAKEREFVLQKDAETKLSESIEKIKKYSQSKGFDFSKEMRDQLLDHLIKNKTHIDNIFSAYLDLFAENIENSYSSLKEKEILEKLQKNKSGVVMGAHSKTPASKTPTFEESMQDYVESII
uniref:Uncharacterized protein n=1 Tax=viral metagenome TaxID=1070528 RepID=A0A6M3J024_9ZZZZ